MSKSLLPLLPLRRLSLGPEHGADSPITIIRGYFASITQDPEQTRIEGGQDITGNAVCLKGSP